MHNHDNKNNSSMMWMMLICVLPLAILFFAGGRLFSAGYLWPLLIIGTMVVAHLFMTFRGHGSHEENSTDSSEGHQGINQSAKTEPAAHDKKGHGCCH